MGSVYPRGNKLYLKLKGPDGKWRPYKTEYRIGQEDLARQLLAKLEERMAAGRAIGGSGAGVLTVRKYAKRWVDDCKKMGLAEWKSHEAWLRIHVLPVIGSMPVAEVRPRHLAALFRDIRAAKKLSSKSVRNVYSAVRGLFREALIAGLIETSPCVLTEHHLGKLRDKDPEWRATAIYTRDELEMLISDPRIPWDRRVVYALEGIGGLRHGEVAGLRLRHYDASLEPLGRLMVARSYDHDHTKTSRTRYMPVHPVLAEVLREWRDVGWVDMMGREPGPDDLFVPCPARRKSSAGRMRDKNYSRKMLIQDFVTLSLRHRRGHDLRRTMISLARTDGARKDLLEVCTHTPHKESSVIDVYTEFPWDSLCGEVVKMKIVRRVTEPAEGTAPVMTAWKEGAVGEC